MDVLYHGLTGIVISKAMGGTDPAAAAICAVLPDLAGTTPFYAFKIRDAWKKPDTSFVKTLYDLLLSNSFANRVDAGSYRFTHSLFTAGLVALMTYMLFPTSWHILSLSYLSHILIDIPTHDGDFATQLFYPLSRFHFEAKNWVRLPKRFFGFWMLLGVMLWQTW